MTDETIQVIVIDPFKQEIRYEQIPNPKLSSDYSSLNNLMYQLMSAGPVKVSCMEAAYLHTLEAKSRDTILIDEEGLYSFDKQRFFMVHGGYHQPLAGIGIVTGYNDEGETIAPSLTLEWFQQNVQFLTFAQIQKMRRGY